MKKFFLRLAVLFIFWGPFQLQAQISIPLHQAVEKTIPLTSFHLSFSTTTPPKAVVTPPPVASLLTAPIPKAYNYEHLGAFCKFEVQLEKAVRLPVKVRLGEVQYTEQLEYGEW